MIFIDVNLRYGGYVNSFSHKTNKQLFFKRIISLNFGRLLSTHSAEKISLEYFALKRQLTVHAN